MFTTKKITYTKATITINGVTRPMTEAEKKEVEAIMDETNQWVDNAFKKVESISNRISRLFDKL